MLRDTLYSRPQKKTGRANPRRGRVTGRTLRRRGSSLPAQATNGHVNS